MIFQSLAQNPLGSPDVIGFNTGAALGAVIVIVVIDGSGSFTVALGAIVGGLITAVIVYLCAWKRGIQTYRLVLVGIGVGFALALGQRLPAHPGADQRRPARHRLADRIAQRPLAGSTSSRSRSAS